MKNCKSKVDKTLLILFKNLTNMAKRSSIHIINRGILKTLNYHMKQTSSSFDVQL